MLVNNITLLPPVFVQVLILKEVKALCFVAFMQVLILKELLRSTVRSGFMGGAGTKVKDRGTVLLGVLEEEGGWSSISGGGQSEEMSSLFIKAIIPHSVHLSSTIHKFFVYSKITGRAEGAWRALPSSSTNLRCSTLLMFEAFKLLEHSA